MNCGKQISQGARRCKSCNAKWLWQQPGFRQGMDKARPGGHLSSEHRQKISEALRGRKRSPETCRRISEAQKGKKLSLEHRRKISEGVMRTGAKPPIKRGKEHPCWRGGRRYINGYVQVKNLEHPHAHASGYVYEHRLVMEKALGRYLEPDEFIHHRNGVRDDNHLENLELVDHHKRHVCPQCGWRMDDDLNKLITERVLAKG